MYNGCDASIEPYKVKSSGDDTGYDVCRPTGMLADVTGSDEENGCHVGTLSEIPRNENEAE